MKASNGEWKSHLVGRMPPHLAAEIDIFENEIALKKQGKSLDDTVAGKPTAAYDAKWGGFVIDPAFFTKLVYEGV